jgi:hypothetical protein
MAPIDATFSLDPIAGMKDTLLAISSKRVLKNPRIHIVIAKKIFSTLRIHFAILTMFACFVLLIFHSQGLESTNSV